MSAITILQRTLIRRGVLVLCLLLTICEDHTTSAYRFPGLRQGSGRMTGFRGSRIVSWSKKLRWNPSGAQMEKDLIAEQQKLGKKSQKGRDEWDRRKNTVFGSNNVPPPPSLKKPTLSRDLPPPLRRSPIPPRE